MRWLRVGTTLSPVLLVPCDLALGPGTFESRRRKLWCLSGAGLLECLPQDKPDAQDEQASLEKSPRVMTLWPSAWTSSSESPFRSQEPQGEDPTLTGAVGHKEVPGGIGSAAGL